MPHDASANRKPIFDTVRHILKRGFRQSEVDAIDDAIERAIVRRLGREAVETLDGAASEREDFLPLDSVSSVSFQPGEDARPTQIGEAGIALIKRFEGCARLRRDGLVEAYPDPGTGADPWTIGWGTTGEGIAHGTVWTQEECDERLARDLGRYADDVARALGDVPRTQAQFDAMVSFHYNTGAIHRATLTKKHRAGDFEGECRDLREVRKAGGRVLKGLVRRRAAEAELYAS